MDTYKPIYNFLIPVLRIGFLVFIIGILVKWMPMVLERRHAMLNDWPAMLYLAFVLFVFILAAYQMIRGLVTQTLLIEVSEKGIAVQNLIFLNTYFIPKQDIVRIYPSERKIGRATWKTISIYSNRGRRLELIQFNYFGFKKIMPAIDKMNYRASSQTPKD
jgi:hypothetical protein